MIHPFQRSRADDATRHALAWGTWPADRVTPVQAFLALRKAGRQVCLLESVEGPARLARYSFLGVDPRASFRSRNGEHFLIERGRRDRIDGTLASALRRVNARARHGSPPGLPPFLGGWIGWFAFEWVSELEPRVPRARQDPWNVPDATFDAYETVVAFDHSTQMLHVVARCDSAGEHARAQDHVDAVAADVFTRESVESGSFHLAGELEPCMDPADYRAGVTRLREAIADGEIFQAVLSQRFQQRFDGDPFTLYRVLRLTNPSPHMFHYEADGLALVGSSPERLVSVSGRRVENRPIAGTRPRGADAREDERLGLELEGDAKERAEHDMLVDLARNDLGRVARIGSVRVREHRVLERFARVQHLVSRAECELAQGRDALDALAASFPAGTVSGAPKVRALELLAGIERDTRGPYAGAFGYLDAAGNLDTALILRTFVAQGGMLSAQSGAGVVFDSDPDRELEETRHKLRALAEAARLAGTGPFQPRAEPSRGSTP